MFSTPSTTAEMAWLTGTLAMAETWPLNGPERSKWFYQQTNTFQPPWLAHHWHKQIIFLVLKMSVATTFKKNEWYFELVVESRRGKSQMWISLHYFSHSYWFMQDKTARRYPPDICLFSIAEWQNAISITADLLLQIIVRHEPSCDWQSHQDQWLYIILDGWGSGASRHNLTL